MVSQQEIDTYLEDFQKQFAALLKAKNIDGLVQLYHPDAAFVHAGVDGVVGRKAIAERLKPFTEDDTDFTVSVTRNLFTGPDAEFIVHEGTFAINAEDGKVFPYRQIFKKTGGKYLIYHDEYTA
uniref:SnoaL-like domain-containing protein n=1 Tax=Panagrellus redivivus TaxID=6233 RepID=A0A7E4VXH1_PANRE